MAGKVETNIQVNIKSDFNDLKRMEAELKNIESIIGGIKPPEHLVNGMFRTREEMDKAVTKALELREEIKQYGRVIENIDASDLFGDLFKTEDIAESTKEINTQLEELGDNANKTSINTNGLLGALTNIASTGKISASSVNSLASSLGVASSKILPLIAVITTLAEALKMFKKSYDDMIQDLNKFGGNIFNGITDGIDWTVDALQDFCNLMEEACEKVQEFNEIGMEAQQGYFMLYNYLGEAGEEVVNFTNNLEGLYNLDASKLVGASRGILGMVSNMSLASEEASELTKAFIVFGQELSAFSGYNFEEVVGQLESAINLGSISVKSPLVRALDLKKEDVEAFRELNSVEERAQFLLSRGEKVRGTYERWLKTSAGKVEGLVGSIEVLNTTIGKITTGLLGQLAPALTMIVTLINNLISGFAELIHIDLTDIEENQGNTAKENEKIANSFTAIGEEAEKAKRKTAGFDDVIQITDSKTSDNNNYSSIDFSDFDLDTWLGDIKDANAELTKFREYLEDLFKNGHYEQAGKVIGDVITEWLDKIPWEGLQDKLYDTAELFSKFFNSLASNNVLGYKIGDTLAEIINTGIVGLESLGENLDFTSIGEFLSASWNGFWEGLKTDDLANTVMTWFIGLFETINGFLSGNPFENTGSTLADLINAFFFGGTNSVTGEETLGLTSERMDEIVNGIIGFINGIFNGIDTFLAEADLEGIKEKLKELITKLMTSFAENSGDWGNTLNNLITTILDTAVELITHADSNGLKEGISNFLETLDLHEILMNYMQLKFQLWFIPFRTKVIAYVGTLGNSIVDTVTQLGQLLEGLVVLIGVGILKGIEWLLQQVFKASDSFRTWLEGLGTTIGNGVGTFIGNIISIIINGIVNINTSVRNGLNNIWENISNIFENIWNTVTGWIKDIRDAIDGMFDGFSDLELNINTPFGNVGIDPSQWEIPFATGGIVNRATHALIGEAGREAVLPLENNTGWMDELASALVSKMNTNNNTGNNSITIDMSGYSKNFYTRAEMLEFGKQVVDALKLYGVNVAAIY